ncbi:MAG: prepilin-type N-terminal cleavage/methylation domain-containing protein, partial [Patescibacteria group bacterium]
MPSRLSLNSGLGLSRTTSSHNGEKHIKDLKKQSGILKTPSLRQRRSGAGFTLVEVIVAIAVFSILLLAVIGLSQQIHQLTTLSSRKTTAATIAQEQMETIRNMPFDQVGSEVTYPTGPLSSTQTVTRNGGTFTVTIAINYIDDPADGTAPTDTVPADYKQVEVRVCWSSSSCARPVRLTTLVVPKTLEYAANAGALFITVIDANGQPVSGADVSVTNASPAVNVVNQT